MENQADTIPYLRFQIEPLMEEEHALNENPLTTGTTHHIVVLSKLVVLLELWANITPFSGKREQCLADQNHYQQRLTQALKLAQAA